MQAENILVDGTGKVRLIDFGFSRQFDQDSLKTFCGSPPYAAPELFLGQPYDGRKADVWSLGVLLFILVAGGFPFPATSFERLKKAVLSASFSIPFRVSVHCTDLIRKMLTFQPAQRASIRHVVHHKWFSTATTGPADISAQTRDLMVASLDPAFRSPSLSSNGVLNESVLLFLQQNGPWPPGQVRESVEGQLFDQAHGAYALLCDKLSRGSVSPVSPVLSLRQPPDQPRRGSITQGTASIPQDQSNPSLAPISTTELAALSVPSPEMEAEVSTQPNPLIPDPNELARLHQLYGTGAAQGGLQQTSQPPMARTPNPNRRHTLCEALSAGAGPPPAPVLLPGTTPFPLDSPLMALHMPEALPQGGSPLLLPPRPPPSLLPCPYGDAWGRRASDNPALSSDLLARLQAVAAEETLSDQPSPSSSSGEPVQPSEEEARLYLRGRGASKRHTIAEAESSLGLPGPGPSRERRRAEPYRPLRRSSDNPGEILPEARAHLQALFNQGLGLDQVVAEMENLRASQPRPSVSICLTDAEGRTERANPLLQFESQVRSLLSPGQQEARDLSPLMAADRPLSELVADLKLTMREDGFSCSETRTLAESEWRGIIEEEATEDGGEPLAIEVRFAASSPSHSQAQLQRLHGPASSFIKLSHSLVNRLRLSPLPTPPSQNDSL